MPDETTSDRILAIARDLVARDGLGALSFDAIAARLGRSKQAVLYWFPSKPALLAAMLVPWLVAETETVEAALSGTANRCEAVERFVRAVAEFHLSDLERFRMMYLLPQVQRTKADTAPTAPLLAKDVHPVTDRLYGMLAHHLGGGTLSARQEAVALHSAVLGLVMMCALADALQDPLKHGKEDLIAALIVGFTSR